ncbi:MAG: hypothetical protein ACTSU2_07105 [Promethearchaeota archaeon]
MDNCKNTKRLIKMENGTNKTEMLNKEKEIEQKMKGKERLRDILIRDYKELKNIGLLDILNPLEMEQILSDLKKQEREKDKALQHEKQDKIEGEKQLEIKEDHLKKQTKKKIKTTKKNLGFRAIDPIDLYFKVHSDNKKGLSAELIDIDSRPRKRKPYILPLNPKFSKHFNELLMGGFREKVLYLVFGKFATGKSQLCHTLSVASYLKTRSNKNPVNILFIDTEDSFRPERIMEIATAYNLPSHEVLKRIKVIKPKNLDNLYTVVQKFAKEGFKAPTNLLIIDSLTNYIRQEFSNENNTFNKTRDKLIRLLKSIRNIMLNNKIIILLTSQVTSYTIKDTPLEERPIMEYVLDYYIEEIIYLKKEDLGDNIGTIHLARLIKSTIAPENTINYKISAAGITDP